MKLLDDYRDDESIYVRSKTNTDFNMVIKINGEAISFFFLIISERILWYDQYACSFII